MRTPKDWHFVSLVEKYYLPRGIHKATTVEIKHKFGDSSDRRRQLFEMLEFLVSLLHKQKRGIKMFILGGSFVTKKQSPKDIDCILVVNRNFDFSSDEVKQLQNARKLSSDVHLFIFTEEQDKEYRGLIDWWSNTEWGQKGLVEVIL